MFHTLDFALFGAFLFLSLIVGLYHGIVARLGLGRSEASRDQEQQKDTPTRTDEFLTVFQI
jgi:hypothetical protein